MINVKNKDLVVPSEVLAEGDYYPGRGTFREGDKICSSLTGLVSLRNKKVSVIPLKSKYIPKRGDVVIGEIDDIRFSMWGVNVNSPYSGILPSSEVFGREKKDLSKVFKVGDVLFLRVVDVDEVKKVKLGLKGRGMGKFREGILVSITPTKVPRLIGKKGSMINMIKDKTNCKIVVGQNGLVWVKGEKEMEIITQNIINLIESQAHTSGLTDRIREKLCLWVDGELPEDFNLEYENDAHYLGSENDSERSSSISESNLNYNVDTFNNEDEFVSNINTDTQLESNSSFNESIDVLEKPKLQDFKKELEEEIKQDNQKSSADFKNLDNINIDRNDSFKSNTLSQDTNFGSELSESDPITKSESSQNLLNNEDISTPAKLNEDRMSTLDYIKKSLVSDKEELNKNPSKKN